MTYEEIAKQMGISAQRVQQLEREALSKARLILESKGYTVEDFFDELRHIQNEEDKSPWTQ